MTTSPIADVRDLYEGCADHYAQMMDAEIDLPVYHDVLSRLAARIDGLSGPIVDTSCGSGHMLARYHGRYDSSRPLVGVDLSPRMMTIASAKLGDAARVVTGDMRDLGTIASRSVAAVISFFAVHHLSPADLALALAEWHRVLRPGGQLLLAAWEGAGEIDYGDESDVHARRYGVDELSDWVEATSLVVDRCGVQPVEDFPMDAIYLEAHRAA